ncbi:hypothetical protein CB1_002395001 [Camelus ferus]|nr:hypothetical protein CB1_002395001 [Camelus ferus]
MPMRPQSMPVRRCPTPTTMATKVWRSKLEREGVDRIQWPLLMVTYIHRGELAGLAQPSPLPTACTTSSSSKGSQLLHDFQSRLPYQYLHYAQFKRNPKHELTTKYLNYYRGLLDAAEEPLKDLEAQPYEAVFLWAEAMLYHDQTAELLELLELLDFAHMYLQADDEGQGGRGGFSYQRMELKLEDSLPHPMPFPGPLVKESQSLSLEHEWVKDGGVGDLTLPFLP